MKLFKKVAILSASLAMVVASGLVIGKAGMKSASAAEEIVASCDFTKQATSSTNYGGAWTYDKVWTIFGGANNNGAWTFVKFGKKQTTGANYIASKEAIAQSISKVEVTTNSGNLNQGTLTSWKLIVASDAAFKTVVEEVAGGAMTKSKAETFEFKPATAVNWAENLFYKVEMQIANTTTKNGCVWLEKVNFYGSVDETAPRITITNKAKDLLVDATLTVETQIDNAEGAVVTWTSSNEEVATVSSEGVVNALAVGTTTIKASMTVNEVEYSDSFELLVRAPHVDHSAVVLPESGKTYKLGFIPTSKKVAYFNGEMSGYYAVASDFSYEGIDVVAEKSAEGWAIKYGTKYIVPAINGTHINFKYSDTLTCYATYMINYNTFRWIVGSNDVYLGSSGTYGTGGGYAWSKVGNKESFPMHLLEPAATAVAPTDKEVVDFFVNEYMHKEVALTDVGTGLCKTNKWYAFAKEAYTSLTEDQKTLFVSDPSYNDYLARYNAWAVANGDSVIGAGALSQVSTRNNVINTNNDMMIIAIISVAAAISFAGLFVFLKRRKTNR